ncbi:MAG: hypothetical protein L0G23_04950, partial [Ruaniaceae bacterium]|nr:hypothetical protein [Ruaniaceae bacterium]
MSTSRLPRWLIAMLAAALVLTPTMASAAPSDETSQRIAELELGIASLVADRDAALTAAAIASEDFLRAQETLDQRAGETEDARAAAAQAREDVDDARHGLGEVAQQAYQSSNPLEGVTAFVDGDDFARALHTSAYLGQIGKQRDAALSDFQALELIAQTLEQAAERAYEAEVEATAELEATSDRANEAAAAANVQLLRSQDQRETLIVQLAAERQVEVEAERARQDRIEQEQYERSQQATPPVSGSTESASGSTAGGTPSTPSVTPTPTPT